MYAVVKTGGKQYQVSAGNTIKVEKLEGKQGDAVELGEVLLVADEEGITLGRPLVDGASVSAEIVEQAKHRKVLIYKFRRRKRYRRKAGHRQPYTALKITGIQVPGAAPASAEP
jgi:large subunit ribosomal protein L21